MHISRSAAVIQSRGTTVHIHHCDSLQTCNYLQISTFVNDIAHHITHHIAHHIARSAAGLVSCFIPQNSSDGSRTVDISQLSVAAVCLSVCLSVSLSVAVLLF